MITGHDHHGHDHHDHHADPASGHAHEDQDIKGVSP